MFLWIDFNFYDIIKGIDWFNVPKIIQQIVIFPVLIYHNHKNLFMLVDKVYEPLK